MKQTFRLPDRSTTDNVEEFEADWDTYIKPLEKQLRVRVLAFDPGFTVLDNDSNMTASVPMWLAERILRI